VKFSYFLIIILFFYGAQAEDWEAKYAEVCKRDSMCERLKAMDGTWLRPKPEITALLKDKDIQNQIQETAKKYSIDPIAIAGAISAENSLNVGLKDPVEDYLAGKGVTRLPVKGQFTFGLGEIGIDTAIEADAFIAKIENRPPRTEDELRKEILSPLGSVRIAGEIMREAQDVYKAHGFDISKDPAILATIYNMGKPEKHASESQKAGRQPRVNYFGLYVEKYTPNIKETFAPASVAVAPAPIARAPTQAAVEAPTDKVQKKKMAVVVAADSDAGDSVAKNATNVEYVSKSLALISAPLLCDTIQGDYGQNPIEQNKVSSFGAPVGVLAKDETYTEIGRALDCKMTAWELVKGSSGVVGWVKNDTLQAAQSSRYMSAPKCTPDPSAQECKSQIEKTAGDLNIHSDQNGDNLMYLKPVTSAKVSKPGFKIEDNRCGFVRPQSDDVSSYYAQVQGMQSAPGQYGPMSGMSTSSPAPSTQQTPPDEIRKETIALNNDIDKELKHMSHDAGVSMDHLLDMNNPYSSVAGILKEAKTAGENCISQLAAEVYMCRDASLAKNLITLLQKTKYEKVPDLDRVTALYNDVLNAYSPYTNSYLSSNYYAPTKDELASATPEQIKKSISVCEDRLENLNPQKPKTPKMPSTAVSPGVSYSNSNPSLGYWTVSSGSQVMYYGVSNGVYYGGLGGMSVNTPRVFEAVKKANDDQITAHKSEFLTFAKMCHARLNMREPAQQKDFLFYCAQTPKFVSLDNLRAYSNEIMTKMFKDQPLKMYASIYAVLGSAISENALEEISPRPNSVMPADREETNGSYCPNKTVEYIENLLQSNMCVKHVYVPTRYLSNALSGFGEKVIYRTFEEGDRYGVDVGGSACK
jgi:Protein of unknown function (DUF1402)